MKMDSKLIKVLLIEDDLSYAKVIQRMLSKIGGASFDMEHAITLSDGLNRMAGGGINLVLLDLGLPDSKGFDTFSIFYGQIREVPIVILTSLDDEDVAIKTAREGAQDYLVKGEVDGHTLLRAIRYAMERHQAIQKLQRTREELKMRVEERTAELLKANEVLKKEIIVRKQAEEALKQANEELRKEQKNRRILSNRLIDLLEKDRHQIAMELHDHIGQSLTSLKMILELLHDKVKSSDAEWTSQISAAEEKAIHILKDIKDISRGLRPAMLDALGLVSSLRELVSELQDQTDMEIRFFSRGIPKRFSPEKELALYRIAQEGVANVMKHANAKDIFVNLIKKANTLSLSVEDNGVGFDPGKAMKVTRRRGPLGLLIMKERAEQLDGEYTIESQIGKGTHLLVEIPL